MLIASLDVESLFTNVPVEITIEIILKNVYEHTTRPPLKVPKNILAKLLRSFTTEALFCSPEGKLFLQIEGVAMGSPLGPTFEKLRHGKS